MLFANGRDSFNRLLSRSNIVKHCGVLLAHNPDEVWKIESGMPMGAFIQYILATHGCAKPCFLLSIHGNTSRVCIQLQREVEAQPFCEIRAYSFGSQTGRAHESLQRLLADYKDNETDTEALLSVLVAQCHRCDEKPKFMFHFGEKGRPFAERQHRGYSLIAPRPPMKLTRNDNTMFLDLSHGRKCAHCGKLEPSKKCSRCASARFCSAECLKAGWKEHKRECVPKNKLDEVD